MKIRNKKTDIYCYECVTPQGESHKGEIHAQNVTSAKAALRAQGYYPLSIYKKRAFFTFKNNIKPQEITYLTRQLATLLSSGISLTTACNLCAQSSQNSVLTNLLMHIKIALESGHTFSEALAMHPNHFEPLFCNLVALGEASGTLDSILNNMAHTREKLDSLKRKIQKTLIYPSMVILIAFTLTGFLLVVIVPQFENLFAGMGAKLPFFTQLVIALSNILQQRWWQFLLAIIIVSWLFLNCKKRYLSFQYAIDKILLNIPFLSSLFKKVYIARFARSLATCFSAGIPIIEALQTVTNMTGNQVYANAIFTLTQKIAGGSPIHLAMRETGVFSHMAMQMVAIGEETGTLDKMLQKIATLLEEEIETTIEGLTSLFEPLTMVFLGILIGGLVIAMYLPIFNLGLVM